jgi:hypothetical protein
MQVAVFFMLVDHTDGGYLAVTAGQEVVCSLIAEIEVLGLIFAFTTRFLLQF